MASRARIGDEMWNSTAATAGFCGAVDEDLSHDADEVVDRHLREVFDGLVSAIYVTEQLVWSVTASPRHIGTVDALVVG